MLRFGILATLIWHYTVDAVLIGTFLIASQSWYFRLSGLLVAGAVLFPLALSIYRYRRNGGFLAETGLTNAALLSPVEPAPSSEAPSTAEVLAAPEPLWPRRYLYIAAAVALVLGLVLSPHRYGDFIRVRLDRNAALAIASRALSEKGVDASQWRSVAQFRANLDPANFEYFRRRGGPEEAERVVAERTLHGFWQVNFFKPQQKEEWIVYVDQSGRAFRTDHELDEKAPGANLTRAEALRIAEHDLRSRRSIGLDSYSLADSSEQRRERRTDHFFVWKDSRFNAGGAEARLSLTILGDEPSEFRRFLKLPDEWLREFRRLRIGRFLMPALMGSVFLHGLNCFHPASGVASLSMAAVPDAERRRPAGCGIDARESAADLLRRIRYRDSDE